MTPFKIEGLISNYKFYAVGEYLPKNRYSDSELNEDEIRLREAIWQFKDGRNIEVNANVIAAKILDKFKNIIQNSRVLCIIPASTGIKTKTRYEKFVSELCKHTKLVNGYDIITNKIDHNAGHLFGKSDDVLGFLLFKEDKIIGKNILLFDDVTTRGNTFSKIAEHLMKLGAKNVTGIFLGKTTYKQISIADVKTKFGLH